MDELISLLGGSLPFLFLLVTLALYFQNRSNRDKPTEDPAVKEPLRWKELEDLRRTYSSLPLDRTFVLYCEYGLKDEARHLIVQEPGMAGLGTGDTVLVESTSQEVQLSSDWIN